VTSPIPKDNQETTQSSEDSLPRQSAEDSLPNQKRGFVAATLEELKLVVWPSRQQLFSESIAVILMVTLSAASIAAVSRFYGWGASQIFR
tara:strand:+ start:565 stop:834 length:270 start_codon:yes stop_codon:yes gene_type:complete